MEEQQLRWTASDGLSLFGRCWAPLAPRSVVVLVHGLGEHSGRYAHLAAFLTQAGYAVMALDLRGHGQSGGQRGHLPSLAQLQLDLDQWLEQARERFPGLPLVGYGHSMGGNLILGYAWRWGRAPFLAGLIASSPWIRLARPAPAWKVRAAKLLNTWWPQLALSNELDAADLSSDSAVVAAYRSDPAVHDRISVRLGNELLNQAEWLDDYRGPAGLPLLLFHGQKDQITSWEGTAALAQRLDGAVSLRLYPDFKHESHNEPGKIVVFSEVQKWLDQYFSRV